MTVARTLANFAATAGAPDETMAQFVRFSLFDWIGVGLAGAREPVAKVARVLALSEGGLGQATLFGGGRVSARTAALANGAASHALDYDDTHFLHIGHPSVAVIPAALALAEARGAGVRELFDSLVVGLETACRIGDWLGRSHYEAGFHQTGTAGAFGATAAAGRILGLDTDRMKQALALTATRASGLKSQFGTMGKPLNAGFAAETGVTCALLAEAGAISAEGAIDGPQGFGPTHAATPRPDAFEGLGKIWVFPGISYKFHACCHGLHAMLEAIRMLEPEKLDLRQFHSLEVHTHPRWLAVCNQPSPATGLAAKFSFRMTAAMALAGVETAALDSYTAETCARPDLVALRDRIEVHGDAALSDTEVRIFLRIAGSCYESSADVLALSDPAEIGRRLREKFDALHDTCSAAALWRDIEGFDGSSDCNELVNWIRCDLR